MAIEAGRSSRRKRLPVEDLSRLREEHRIITGIHEVYGRIYRELGLDLVLPAGRQRMSNRVLYHTVMARIANPDSKRASVRRLERDFGVLVPLEKGLPDDGPARRGGHFRDAGPDWRLHPFAVSRADRPGPVRLHDAVLRIHLRGHLAGLRLQQGRKGGRGPGPAGTGGDTRRPAAGLRGSSRATTGKGTVSSRRCARCIPRRRGR